MSNSLYITSTEARSGKSAICLGIMEMLLRKIDKVGFFRPIIKGSPGENDKDHDIQLISSRFNLGIPYEKMIGYTAAEAADMIGMKKDEELFEGIITKYKQLAETCQFILCEGTDFASSLAALEFDINAEVIRNLGSSVLLVANAHLKGIDETIQSIETALESLNERGCQPVGTIINRTHPDRDAAIIERLTGKGLTENQLIYAIPDVASLGKPTIGEIAQILDAEVLFGEEFLNRHAHCFTVAAMHLENLLPRIERGSLIITPGDRADVILACLSAAAAKSFPQIAGLILTGGIVPAAPIWKLIKGSSQILPILSVNTNTFPTATAVDKIYASISPDDDRKITQALAVFEKHVNVEKLSDRIINFKSTVVTPKMFEYELIQKAKAQKKHIVLPEGAEERILKASEILLRREVVDITLLGNIQTIQEKIARLGLRMESLIIVEPAASDLFEEYTDTYYELRKHKGITRDNARDVMSDATYFGTMMVYKKDADGMVSGAVHSTAATVRPAFEIIKTKPGISIVSSVFFMCLSSKVLVYGDCAVNPNPNADQLAAIAISSAQTAQSFGIEPIVAMLSYSTGASGKGEDVEKVRKAAGLAKEMATESFPDLKIDGPIQYDAAIDPSVAKTKMPGSDVAGNATVLIFPDLNTGNNTYKAVQRSAAAVAVGPVLQGLKHPVNDLSRGCTIPDIVNTVAITAIQAQAEKGDK
jgi:phosphate acetyltransferase